MPTGLLREPHFGGAFCVSAGDIIKVAGTHSRSDSDRVAAAISMVSPFGIYAPSEIRDGFELRAAEYVPRPVGRITGSGVGLTPAGDIEGRVTARCWLSSRPLHALPCNFWERAMPNWEGSNRKARLPKDWQKIRKRILARDGERCTWLTDGVRCQSKANNVDHIIAGDDHTDANLRSLCAHHHGKKSSSEGGRARRRASRYRVTRPAEGHPGLRSTPRTQ